MKLGFCSLASGSSGNCYLIKSDNTNLLLDAGISCKAIQAGLESLGEAVTYGMADLEKVTLPETMIALKEANFTNCASLTEIISLIEVPLTLSIVAADGKLLAEIPFRSSSFLLSDASIDRISFASSSDMIEKVLASYPRRCALSRRSFAQRE